MAGRAPAARSCGCTVVASPGPATQFPCDRPYWSHLPDLHRLAVPQCLGLSSVVMIWKAHFRGAVWYLGFSSVKCWPHCVRMTAGRVTEAESYSQYLRITCWLCAGYIVKADWPVTQVWPGDYRPGAFLTIGRLLPEAGRGQWKVTSYSLTDDLPVTIVWPILKPVILKLTWARKGPFCVIVHCEITTYDYNHIEIWPLQYLALKLTVKAVSSMAINEVM